MNTDTGRIYDPEEFERRQQFAANPALIEQLERAADKEREKLEQREFEQAVREGKIVEVSEHVANLVREGKASAESKAKRKAARAARKKNRHGRQ